MATIAQQLTELVNQKNALAANLTTKGVTASSSETLNTLVPKVLDIQTGGTSKLPQVIDKSVTTITADDLAGATEIGFYTFYMCGSLTTVEIPDSVMSIGLLAFYNCSNLTSITIPNGVTSIGNSAFSVCSKLTSITLPSTLTSIGVSAFENCSNLTSITIPNGVTLINNYIFRSCSSLASITIPEGVTSIGSGAFSDCSSLTSITIPNGVTSIGISAFLRCSSLTTMRVEATTPPTLRNTNAISTATTQIQVPMASVDAYKTATNWSNFADIIVGYEEETT